MMELERMNRFIRELSEAQWLSRTDFREWEITRATYMLPGQYEEVRPYPEGQELERFPSKQGMTYFFRAKPDLSGYGQEAGLLFESGGEGLLRVNGASYQGLDRNHTYAALDLARTGPTPELEIELFDPVPEPVDPLNRQAVIQPPITRIRSELVQPNKAVQSLMYTAIVVRDTSLLLPEPDMRRFRLHEALHAAMDAYADLDDGDIREGSAVQAIEAMLAAKVRETGSNAEGTEHMVGQSHIDIAWLWPMRETVRKASRTFSTVDALMKEFPDFRYSQSQPLLYEFLKRNDPELFERVKQRIAEGRWELVGGMWVEPDLNIPSGESLMRQMLYGQTFYKKEFGLVSHIEWLPDTFGYCASLPQILKHGNIAYFMTTKLGWNDTNVFPYDLFHWVGIDGTPILSYLNHGVNEHTLPKDIHDHWQSYRQKQIHNEQMLLYGHGDGGGGVTREMLEYIGRSELMVGQPAGRYSTAAEFFAGISERSPELPEWRGDLYLELHRGTYTTHARNKRSNRKAESLYREAELWQALAAGGLTPEEKSLHAGLLHEGWKLMLNNQFHDIIPGSAITETYETSAAEYTQVLDNGSKVSNAALAAISRLVHTEHEEGGIPYIVFNSLGWERDMQVEVESSPQLESMAAYAGNGEELPSDDGIATGASGSPVRQLSIRVPAVPAFGYKTFWLRERGAKGETAGGEANSAEDLELGGRRAVSAESELGSEWETAFYRLRFNERGEICSLIDKEADREIVQPGEAINRFYFYHDRPTLWDAWDIDSRYEDQPAGEAVLLDKAVVLKGRTKDVLRFRWKLHQSEITQQLVVYHGSRRIDFVTKVHWNEAHKLLKVGFPIDVVTDKATYEIPFGALERTTRRNTSWERAQFEVCGHRFADLSEAGYGVSLLNDCKYGYDAHGSTIRLSLLRAPKWPDATADLGEHEFTYSLYPHAGDWRESHTARMAAELHADASIVAAEPQQGAWPAEGSLIRFAGKHVILETVKPSEDGRGTVLRLYESAGGRESVSIGWPQPVSQAYLSNALEDELEPLPCDNGEITLAFRPFEIKTVKLIGAISADNLA